jgi:two-component system sensor histidine kinase KdpD
MPLSARGRIVGVLVALSESGLDLEEAPRRFAHALRFYAALAVERVRLVAAAEHAAALRETDRLRNALLASVSHDLRTPLTTIKALAQDSERQRDLDRALHNVRVIEEHADRLARVVSNLLDVTRLRANTLPVHPEFNTAEDLIGAVTRQVAGVLGRHPLERRVEERDGVLAGCFDFVQSLRILTNLVENAARYSPPDAPITLSAHRDGESLVLAVADRGAGIPIPERTRIFEPFYRSPAAAPDVGGTGLGLYIARALAEAQGGTLTYAPRMPSGSVFTLRVPALEAPDADGAEVTDDHVEARTTIDEHSFAGVMLTRVAGQANQPARRHNRAIRLDHESSARWGVAAGAPVDAELLCVAGATHVPVAIPSVRGMRRRTG